MTKRFLPSAKTLLAALALLCAGGAGSALRADAATGESWAESAVDDRPDTVVTATVTTAGGETLTPVIAVAEPVPDSAQEPASASVPANSSEATAPVVRALVVWTPALEAERGADGVRALVNRCVEETNAAFERSGVSGKLLLGENDAGDTAARRVEYTESTRDYMDDLNALSDWHEGRNSTMVVRKDGVMDEVHLWRNEFRADIVVLLRKGAAAGTAGLAWTLDTLNGAPDGAFAIVGAGLNDFTFTHEVGHNLGLSHDHANAAGVRGVTGYAYGHTFTGDDGRRYGTIMAYDGDRSAGYFSTPLKTLAGKPLGVAEGSSDAADSVRALALTLPVVAAYRENKTLAAPRFETAAGEYADTVTVVLAFADGTAGDDTATDDEIRYTTDGSEPDENSPLYTGAFTLAAPDTGAERTVTVRARVFAADAWPLLGPETTAVFRLRSAAALRAANGSQIAAGDAHTVLAGAAGEVIAFGDNARGQLGDGSGDPFADEPREIAAAGIAAVAAGGAHTLLLDTAGGLYAFGRNDHGQLGDGSTADRAAPAAGANGVLVPVFTGALLAAAGGAHSLVVATDGSLWVAGANARGQLGLGGKADRDTFARAAENIVRAAAGGAHSLLVARDGSLLAAGANERGQLGDGSTDDRDTFAKIALPAAIPAVAEIAAGGAHSLLLATDGSLWAAGDNAFGQLGADTGGADFSAVFVRVAVPENTAVTAVAAGARHTLLITDGGDLYGCGDNSDGQLGADPAALPRAARPVLIARNVIAAAAGGAHTLFTDRAGTVFAVGANTLGQLGDGGGTERNFEPARVENFSAAAPPRITAQPAAAAVEPGARVVFSVAAETSAGSAPLAYQWRRDGVEIAGATAATLVISAAGAADAGVYSVLVTDARGFATLSEGAVLTLRFPDGWTPETGTGAPRFTGTGATLAHCALPAPAARNALEALFDALRGIAPPAADGSAEIEVAAGATVTFSAPAAGGGVPAYQWLRNGATETGEGANGATLARDDIADGDTFAVRVTTEFGSAESAPVRVRVAPVARVRSVSWAVPADASLGAAPVSVRAGGTLRLSVVAETVGGTGSAQIFYQWFRAAEPEDADGEAVAGAVGPSLEIRDVAAGDAGEYWCVVATRAGSPAASRRASVEVLP
ncbi:MAG: M12 family metallo-peptidase [Puniceicoccales bacterium]|jgi:alpha-tubulin suppressor-like RCC1 family protein|nr:M12 family metallo-peptidase [Puniceicoccales bacterium]